MAEKFIKYPLFLQGKPKFGFIQGDLEVNPPCEITFEKYNEKIIKTTQNPLFDKDSWQDRQTEWENYLTNIFYTSKTNKGTIMTCCFPLCKPFEAELDNPENSGIIKIIHAKYNGRMIDKKSHDLLIKGVEKATLKKHIIEIEKLELINISLNEVENTFTKIYENIPRTRYMWTI